MNRLSTEADKCLAGEDAFARHIAWALYENDDPRSTEQIIAILTNEERETIRAAYTRMDNGSSNG